MDQQRYGQEDEVLLGTPYDGMIAEHSDDVIMHWKTPEFESHDRDKRWYLTALFFVILIVSYAVFTNNPITAITFILIAVVGYIFLTKEPRMVSFSITHEGLIIDRDIYEFDHTDSFWIFYDPPHIKTLSLKLKRGLVHHLYIPIGNQNPVELRELLLKFIPEEKQEYSMVDTIARILHI